MPKELFIFTRDGSVNPVADPAHRPRRVAVRASARRAGIAALATMLLTIVAPFNASAAAPFEVRSAESRLYDGVWYATALIDFQLSDEALAALRSGVVLTIELQIRVSSVRRFWLDKETASLAQRFELRFQPLSERYVTLNLNSGEQASFATLFSALSSMGRIVNLPIIDDSLLDPDAEYEISMRAVLDQNTLPGPLRMLAFWSSGFRLESEWFVWTLNA